MCSLWCIGFQGSASTSYTAPRLTYPQDTHDTAAVHAEESESDILPFAIDGDTGDATSSSAVAPAGIKTLRSFSLKSVKTMSGALAWWLLLVLVVIHVYVTVLTVTLMHYHGQ